MDILWENERVTANRSGTDAGKEGNMLTIKNLSKTYGGGKKAVDHLSLEIVPGDIYGFIGHNSAGKTTTIKAVVGIIDFWHYKFFGRFNFFRINETVHSKDPKKKAQLLFLGILYLLLGVMIIFYVGMLSYAYLAVIISFAIIFFTIFKTGSTIFQLETYEMPAAMPVSPA